MLFLVKVVDPDNIHNIIWNDSMGPGAARFIKKEYPVLVRLGKPLCFVKLEAIIRHLKVILNSGVAFKYIV